MTTQLAGTWVGLADTGGPRRLVVAHIAEDGAASVDLPGEGRFRLPATLDGDAGTCTAPDAELSFKLGAGGLEREEPMSPGDLAWVCGTYETHANRVWGPVVLVGSRAVAGRAVPFLYEPDGASGGEVIRLYPAPGNRLWSERGEVATIIPDSGPTLVVETPEDAYVLVRRHLYDEEPLSWVSSDTMLSGTLLLPLGAEPTACVILMHGTEPGTRDFYRLFAHSFLMAGMAALVFDKRGFGESGGAVDSLLVDRARDVAAAIGALRSHPRIDESKIGLWAFSNGTWSAPMIAAGMADVRFVVLVGAAGVSPAEAEIHRKLLELREWDVPDAKIERVRRAWTLAYRCVVGEWDRAWDAEYDTLMAELHGDAQLAAIPLADYARRNPWLAPVPPNISSAALREMAFGQLPEMGYDPCIDLARTTAPVLFVVGEADTNTPGPEGARRVREALDVAGHPASRVELIPRAGHFLNEMLPVTGMSAAEAAGELHRLRFIPGFFELVTNWTLAQTSS